MGVIEAFGKFQIYGFVFVMFIVSVIFLSVGIWLVRRPEDTTHTSTVQGTFSNVVCVNNQCSATVEYIVPCSNTANCTTNTFTLTDTFGQVKDGDSITIYYNPDRPDDALTRKPGSKTIGWVFIAVALFFLLLSLFIGRKFYTASNNNRQSYARLAAIGGAARYLS
jgi:hypothetical protein